ncbi:hypothetical protein MMC20_006863 [Loxospora ochrophaea]|nr:hypothetical protein [Loxospora ochrophaea]
MDASPSPYPTVSIPDKVNIVTWFLMVTTCLAVLTRIASKLLITRLLSSDDYVISVALLCSVCESIATSLQTANGLGTDFYSLDRQHVRRFQKATYAAELLYIPTLCLAKLSALVVLLHITPVPKDRLLAKLAGALVILWAVAAQFAVAFQCELPRPWASASDKCFDLRAFWIWFGIFDIVEDICVIALPIYIIWKLQMRLSRKVVILVGFASRFFVIIATISRLAYLGMNSVFSAASPNLWVVVLCTQVEQNLSLITACVPYHKPFFKSVESGMLRNDDLRRRDKYATIQEYAMSMFRPGGKDRGQDGSERIARHDTAAGHNRPFDGLDTNATTMMSNARHSPHGIPELDTGSSRGTDRLVIKEARDFRLEYSDVETNLPRASHA